MDPTTLFIVEPEGPMLFFAGAASATPGDGLVPDQLDEKAERAEPMDDLKGLVMLGLFPIFALFPIWFVPACIVAAAWLVA